MYFICKASINRQLYCPPTTTTTDLRQREQARRIERCPVSLSHAFRFRVQGIKIYDIFITKTSAVSCGRTTGFPTPLPLPFHAHTFRHYADFKNMQPGASSHYLDLGLGSGNSYTAKCRKGLARTCESLHSKITRVRCKGIMLFSNICGFFYISV